MLLFQSHSIFTTVIGRKQGKEGEDITLQVCGEGNREAYQVANGSGTLEVKCYWEMEPKIGWQGVYMLGR